MLQKGFTLMELLVVIFIIALIPLIFVFSVSRSSVSIEEEKQEDLNKAFNDILATYFYLGIKNGTINYFMVGDEKHACVKTATLIQAGYLLEEEYEENIIFLIKTIDGKIVTEVVNDLSICRNLVN